MAAEEDKKFDAVVGGFLANGLRVRTGHIHCPEPDVLAAYHERSLLPQEMNSWKEHIVGCTRCQSILAELKATDAIPLPAEKERLQLAEAVAAAATRASGRIAAPSALSDKVRSPRPIRAPRWQWLIPAGALAAGLFVWVAWHEKQPHLAGPAEVKMARVEPLASQVPAPAPTVAQKAPASSASDQFSNLSEERGVIGGMASEKKAPPPAENLKPLQNSQSRAKVAAPKLSTDKENGVRRDAERDSALAANSTQNQPSLDTNAAVVGAMAETVQVEAQAETAAAQKQLNAQKTPGPSPLGQAGQTAKAKSGSAANAGRILATPAPASPPSALSNAAPMRLAAVASPHWISAPDKKTLWRIGYAGMIEFSSDGGASWSRQNGGALTDLTAGSAPSDKVCWIVGRAGTILLTTDAGSDWTVVRSPFDEDLGGVRATDALHATVWNLANTKVFETFDGGLIWKPIASQ